VHARVADESDAAACHAAADPFDPSHIAADLELVAGRPLDGEKVVHPSLAFSQIDREGTDRVVRQRRHHIR